MAMQSGCSVPAHFDTLRYFQTLLGGGFTEQQARAMTIALKVALAEYYANECGPSEARVQDQSQDTFEAVLAQLQLSREPSAAPWQVLVGETVEGVHHGVFDSHPSADSIYLVTRTGKVLTFPCPGEVQVL